MSAPAKLMKREEIVQFFSILQAANPEPKTELEYASPFELLAAVLLSAQATDISVNKATRPLFARANTPQAILDLGLEQLEDALKTIGLYRSKAKNLLATCHILVNEHGGEVPASRAASTNSRSRRVSASARTRRVTPIHEVSPITTMILVRLGSRKAITASIRKNDGKQSMISTTRMMHSSTHRRK